jgi:uncharacterized protein (DUF2147 family)
MKSSFLKYHATALCVLTSVATSSVFAQATPIGTWHTLDDETGKPTAEIRIIDKGNGELSGTIVKSLIGPSDKNNSTCTLCGDDRKDKSKIGLEIIRGAKQTEGSQVWEGGNILDPNKGKIYRLRLTPSESGKQLQVRGYVGPFFRTQIWTRVE